MEVIKSGNIEVLFNKDEKDTAELVVKTCDGAIRVIQENLGLTPPKDCQIYIMTSWFRFIFQSAPWTWRLLLGVTIPLWSFRARKTWRYSVAWTQRYGTKVAIGMKPQRLLEQSGRDVTPRFFIRETDPKINIQQVTCHELVHACSSHLTLPMWLNEGLAIFTAEQFIRKPLIKSETLEMIKVFYPKSAPPSYKMLARMDMEKIAYHTIRGYWIVKYLETAYTGLLISLLSQHLDSSLIDRRLATELKIEPFSLWDKIDEFVVSYFEMNGTHVGDKNGFLEKRRVDGSTY
jgi:hypothetical protein